MTTIALRGPPDRILTEREETQAGSLIGTMQWYASILSSRISLRFGTGAFLRELREKGRDIRHD